MKIWTIPVDRPVATLMFLISMVVLGAVALKLQRMPLFRYVDDYFGLDSPDTVKHAMECFARLLRALLGATAAAEGKLEWGSSLVVLGMQVSKLMRVRADGQSLLDKS